MNIEQAYYTYLSYQIYVLYYQSYMHYYACQVYSGQFQFSGLQACVMCRYSACSLQRTAFQRIALSCSLHTLALKCQESIALHCIAMDCEHCIKCTDRRATFNWGRWDNGTPSNTFLLHYHHHCVTFSVCAISARSNQRKCTSRHNQVGVPAYRLYLYLYFTCICI